MKKLLLLNLLLLSTVSFSQTKTATTEDGKKVILKENNTRQYANASESKNTCVTEKGFKEPKRKKA